MKKHLCTGLAGGILLLGTAGLSQAASLVITGVIDGPLPGGTPKAVELYAYNNINDLSVYGLGFANNGGGSDGIEFTFPAISVSAGDFLYVASEAEEFFNFFGFTPDSTSSAATINGDDAIELFKDATVVDVFGNIAVDGTGQPWEYLDGWAYRNDSTDSLVSSAFLVSEWYFSGPDALDNEMANLAAANPFPAGSFSSGTPPQPLPTPEPAAMLLFGSGLACLAANRLRRERTKRSG